jgi:hypothetical protein
VRYTDKDGDVWEDVGSGRLLCVSSSVAGFEGVSYGVEYVEEQYGPLRAAREAGSDEPAESDDLPTVADVMSRADIFQSAHALVKGLEWDEKASVYDVLQVAKWLEGDG